MMTAVVGSTAYLKPETLLDADGNPVTTKVDGDWTKSARLLGGATTATPTITHVANGIYDIAVDLDTVGNWSVEYSVMVDGETVLFEPQIVNVVTPAQADPLAAPVAGYADGTAGARLYRIGTGTVQVSAPVAESGAVTIVQGDDYAADTGSALEWALTNAPDLTDAAWVRLMLIQNGGPVVTVDCAVSGAGTATQTVTAELTAAQTASLDVKVTTFRARAQLANGRMRTLVSGPVRVLEDTTQ